MQNPNVKYLTFINSHNFIQTLQTKIREFFEDIMITQQQQNRNKISSEKLDQQ